MKLPSLLERTPRPEGPATEPLNAYAGAGHLLACPDGVWALYAFGGVDYHGRSAEHRAALARAQAHRWAELVGHRVRIRQTSSPVNMAAWAARLDAEHPAPGSHRGPTTLTHRIPDKPDGVAFTRLTEVASLHAAETGKRKAAAVLSVRLSTRTVKQADLGLLLQGSPLGSAKLEDVRRARVKVDQAVAKPGFEAQPLVEKSIEWLTHASLGMGAPVPPTLLSSKATHTWDEKSILGFTNPVSAYAPPYSLTTTLHIARESASLTRHVAVQMVDKFSDRHIDVEPFLSWTLAYPHPLEVMGEFDVIDGATLKRKAEKARKTAREIEAHYLEHGDDPPREVARGIVLALDIEDAFAHGDTPTRTVLLGTWLVAVTAETEQEALDAATALRVAAEESQGVTLVHDFGQYRLWRSFTPGEPFPVTGGHECNVPAKFSARALTPNVSVEAGDPAGFPIGPIAGGHDLMLFDHLGGSRRNGSGVCLYCANQGGGKSALAGAGLWWAIRLGIRSVGVDPAGLWRRFMDLPDLKGDVHFIDVASAKPGTLVPTVMIPEPQRRDFEDETKWREAVATSEAERVESMIDTFAGLLPWDYRQETKKLTALLTTSCAHVGGAYGEDPWRYVADLRERGGETGREVADLLAATATLRGGSLVFPAPGSDVDPLKAARLLDRATGSIISTHGLSMPPAGMADRALWTPAQQATVPILGLVARLAALAMYADRNSPTHITIDELRLIATLGSSFPAFINRVAVDSRKWLAFVGLIFQTPQMILDVDPAIGNLAGAAWVGRLDAANATAARTLLRDDDPASGLEDLITDQTAGEFVVRDWLGRIRHVYVDQSWWPRPLYEALDTTPGTAGAYDDKPGALFGVPA